MVAVSERSRSDTVFVAADTLRTNASKKTDIKSPILRFADIASAFMIDDYLFVRVCDIMRKEQHLHKWSLNPIQTNRRP
jgi:hypothetical protein